MFNLLFLVLMALMSLSQMVLIWLYLKCKQPIPLSNVLMTLGSLLVTLAADLGLHAPMYQSVFGIVVYLTGMILILTGGIGSYRQIKSNLLVNKAY